MVWRQPRTTNNSRLPIQTPSPAHTLREDRCFECHLGARPCTRHPTCLHQSEFAPTPNRFSILAGLSPPPDTKWDFDFTPASRPSPKRRGKRGGKQQRLKHALNKTHEKAKLDRVDKLCDRLGALHLDSHVPMTVVQQNSDEPLRSHPLQTPKPEDLSEEALRSQTPPPFRQGLSSINSSVDILPSNRKLPPQFPLSAFLKDLASPTERRERWPRSPPTPQPAIPWQETPPPPYTVMPSTTPAGPGAADATTGFPSCNAERTPEAVSVTWPSSSDTAATNKRPLAFDATPFTPASESIPATHTLLSTPPPPATTSPLFPVLGPGPSPLGVATTLPTSTVPLVEFSHPSMTQQVSTTRKPRLPALQRSSFSWHDTLEGNTVFRPSPAAMITAPITSPYPFVYPSRPWSPAAVSLDLSKNTASVQSMLRRRLALNCSSPEAQANLTTFLDMGHAKNCWCSKFNHGEPAKPADSTGTTLGRDALLEARSAGSDNSSSDAMEDTAHAPGFLGETEEDIDSDIAGHDGILILSATEDASSEFEELETIDGQPVNSDSDSDSDDEDWCAIPPRAHSPPSAPSPSSWTVSDVSARSSNASPVYELSAALPSPNRAPTVDTKRALVSGDESETE